MIGKDPAAMYARTFRKAAHVRSFTIVDTAAAGWEIREEHDSTVVRTVRYHDWHRVERARLAFAQQAQTLEETGWTES